MIFELDLQNSKSKQSEWIYMVWSLHFENSRGFFQANSFLYLIWIYFNTEHLICWICELLEEEEKNPKTQ